MTLANDAGNSNHFLITIFSLIITSLEGGTREEDLRCSLLFLPFLGGASEDRKKCLSQ